MSTYTIEHHCQDLYSFFERWSDLYHKPVPRIPKWDTLTPLERELQIGTYEELQVFIWKRIQTLYAISRTSRGLRPIEREEYEFLQDGYYKLAIANGTNQSNYMLRTVEELTDPVFVDLTHRQVTKLATRAEKMDQLLRGLYANRAENET